LEATSGPRRQKRVIPSKAFMSSSLQRGCKSRSPFFAVGYFIPFLPAFEIHDDFQGLGKCFCQSDRRVTFGI
jgi:hypothetical protein